MFRLSRRRAWRTLPWLCVFIGWGLLSDIVGLVILTWYPPSYFRWYEGDCVFDFVLTVLVLVELVQRVSFRSSEAVRWWQMRSGWLSTGFFVALLGLFCWLAAGVLTLQSLGPSSRFIYRLGETAALLPAAIWLPMVLAGLLSPGKPVIREASTAMRVAGGLGVYSLVHIAISWERSRSPLSFQSTLDSCESAAYLAMLMYWVVAFAPRREPVSMSVS